MQLQTFRRTARREDEERCANMPRYSRSRSRSPPRRSRRYSYSRSRSRSPVRAASPPSDCGERHTQTRANLPIPAPMSGFATATNSTIPDDNVSMTWRLAGFIRWSIEYGSWRLPPGHNGRGYLSIPLRVFVMTAHRLTTGSF